MYIKLTQHLSLSKLCSLPVLNIRQETISIDFIIKLPEFVSFDTVMTVVNSMFKITHFIPIHTTVTVRDAARLFLYNVWKLHSLSICVVSDREM